VGRDILAIIPARGGSKGIPRKNLALLAGKPLIDYTIEAAQGSRRFSRIVVSTDDSEISNHAKLKGVEVPFLRPAELSGDDTPMLDVVRHAIDALAAQDAQAVVLLQPTSPFRRPSHIDASIRLFEQHGADAVVSVMRTAHRYAPESQLRIDASGRLHPYLPSAALRPRQEKEVLFVRNGPAVLVCRTEAILRGTLYGEHVRGFEMGRWESIDIDDTDDLALAEWLLERGVLSADKGSPSLGREGAAESPGGS
jgi:CMP-N,N'-diacetyllegionaminic acid synthase